MNPNMSAASENLIDHSLPGQELEVKRIYNGKLLELIPIRDPSGSFFTAKIMMKSPHAKANVAEGDLVITSPILQIDFELGMLETRNSFYYFDL